MVLDSAQATEAPMNITVADISSTFLPKMSLNLVQMTRKADQCQLWVTWMEWRTLQVYVKRYVTTTQLARLYPPSSDAIVIKEVDCIH
jgi:hypothetical protein